MRCAFFQRQAWPVMMPAAAVHSSKTSATAANFVKPVVAQANTSKASAAEFKKPCALPAHVAARGRLVYRKTATAMPSTAAVANSHKTGFTNEKYGVMATAVIIGEDRFFVAITRTQGLGCCKFASVFARAVCSSCLLELFTEVARLCRSLTTTAASVQWPFCHLPRPNCLLSALNANGIDFSSSV